MSDFLADRLTLFLSETRGLELTDHVSPTLHDFVQDARTSAFEISGRELYAFERSALNAAADLRIDKPDRLDRLTEAVLKDPRRIFIETRGADKACIGAGIRGFLDTSSAGEDAIGSISGYGERWGVFVDILGDGQARFRSVYTRPRNWLRGTDRTSHLAHEVSLHPKAWKAPLERAFSFDFAPEWKQLNIHSHIGTSREEFDMAMRILKPGADPIIDKARDEIGHASGPRAISRIQDSAWRLARFRDLIRPDRQTKGTSSPLAKSLSSLTVNHNALALEDGIALIAMLAVLQADSSDIRKSPRPVRSKGSQKKTGKASSKEAPIAQRLSVVRLNLEDKGLQRIYEGTPIQDAGDTPSRGTEHKGRRRHPVRGHLFLARNMKMMWRRPHWRGTLEQHTIRKVVAPSHKGAGA